MRPVGLAIVVLVLMLVGTSRVDATCVCGDIDDCGSAPQCAGSRPGLTCTPPANGGVCHVTKGLALGVTCCCGCSRRGNAAAVANCTDKYSAIGSALALVVAGPDPSLCLLASVTGRGVAPTTSAAPVVEKAGKKIEKQLGGARTKCEKENGRGEQARQKQSNDAADKLKDKLDRLEKRGKIAPGCANAYGALIDSFKTADQPGASTTTTTTVAGTTTTTQVAGPVVVSTGFSTFPAGTHICLSRFGGSYCLTDGGLCGALHVHANGGVTVDGASAGTDPQTTGNHCGYGTVQPEEPGCTPLPDFPPDCP